MEIIFYHPTFDTQYWICELEKQLPGARVREWKAGDNRPADYATGLASAGRDAAGPGAEGRVRPRGRGGLYSQQAARPSGYAAAVDSAVSSRRYRYGTADAGVCREPVLHWFRRFDDYQALKLASAGSRCPSTAPTNSPSGLWAPACWGRRLRKVCNPGGSRFASGAVAANPAAGAELRRPGRAGRIPAGHSRADQPAAEYRRNRRHY